MDEVLGPSESDENFAHETLLEYILNPSMAQKEMGLMCSVGGDWEITGHATRASTGIKVAIPSFFVIGGCVTRFNFSGRR